MSRTLKNLLLFDINTVQDFKELINILSSEGIETLADARAYLESFIDNKLKVQSKMEKRVVVMEQGADGKLRAMKECPSCGKKSFGVVINEEGLKIRGCRFCRYSEIVE